MQLVFIIIGLAVLLYLAFIYTSESLAMLFFFLLIFIIVTELAMVICHWWVKCRIRIPISTVDVGNGVGVEVTVSSPSAWVGPRLRFVVVVRNTFTGRTKKIRTKVGKRLGKEVVYPFVLTLPEAGNYEISLKSVKYYDRTGLVSFKMKPRGQVQSVQVLPELKSVPIHVSQPVRRFYGESDIYDEEHEGSDSSEMFGVREFEQGDKLQKIHWKLSARTDEWMVRQDSQPKACAVVVLLDYEGRSKRRQKKNIRSDSAIIAKAGSRKERRGRKIVGSGAFLEMAGSISFTLMDLECPHYMVWYDEKSRDAVRIRVDSEESFYEFLTRYLSGQGGCPPEELSDMYQEKYKSEHYLHSLRLTQDLTIYKDEEAIYTPKDGAWEQVEILL